MSDAITVSCPECDTKLRLKDRRAVGKRVKCPKCEVPFLVQVPAGVEDDPLDFLDDFESSSGSRSRASADDEFDDFDAPAKPKKKKTSSKKKKRRRKSSVDWQQPALIGGGVLLLLLLLGGGVYLATGMSVSGNPVDMTYLPADADILVKIDLGDVSRAPLLNPFMENPAVKDAMAKATEEVGLGLGDIESVTLGMNSGGGGANAGFPGMPLGMGAMNPLMGAGNPISGLDNGLAVIRLAKPLDPQKLVAGGDEGALKQHAGRSLISRPGAKDVAMLLATDTMLIVGPEAKVTAAYDAGPVQIRRPEFGFVNPDMQVLFAFAPRDRQVFKDMAAKAPVPEGADKHVLDATLALGGGFNVGSNIDVEIWYSLEDRSAAKMVYRGLEAEKKQARDALAQARNMLAMFGPQMKPSGEKLLNIADQTVDSMSASTSGSFYTMEMTIPGSVGPAIQELAANAGNMGGMGLPGAMPGPGTMPSGPSSFGAAGGPPGAGAAFPGQSPAAAFPGGQPPGAAAFPGGQPPAGPAGGFPGAQPPAGGFPAGGFPAGGPNPGQAPAAFPGAPANLPAGPAANPAAFPQGPAGGFPPGAAPANPGLPPGIPGRQ